MLPSLMLPHVTSRFSSMSPQDANCGQLFNVRGQFELVASIISLVLFLCFLLHLVFFNHLKSFSKCNSMNNKCPVPSLSILYVPYMLMFHFGPNVWALINALSVLGHDNFRLSRQFRI